jgi:hypothetical protein
MVAPTIRQRLFGVATDEELDRYAQKQGFPSWKSMAVVTRIGAKLAQGAKLDASDLKEVQAAYPAVPAHVIAAYARNVSNLEDLVNATVGNTPATHAQAKQLVEHYITADYTASIQARRDGGKSPSTEPRVIPAHERPEAVRTHLKNAIYRHESPEYHALKNAGPAARREFLHGRLVNAENRVAHVSATKDASRLDALAAAFDYHTVRDFAQQEAEAGVDGLSDIVEGGA